MISPSKITQLVSRFSRSPDGSRGHLIIFFATEAHPAGYEASSSEVDFSHTAEHPIMHFISLFLSILFIVTYITLKLL